MQIKNFTEFINEGLIYQKGHNQSFVNQAKKQFSKDFKDLFRVSENSFSFIGSAGKKKKDELSFNVNFGLSVSEISEKNNIDDKKKLSEFIKEQLKRIKCDCEILENNKLIINYPYKDKILEVHVKLTNNLDFLSFSRYSPLNDGVESKYTGKYRELLFKSITENIKKDIVEYFDDKNTVKEFQQYLYEEEDGLFVIHKSFVGKNGLLKKSIALPESKRLITDNIDEFTKILFGKKIKKEDLMTLEGCINALQSKSFAYPKKYNVIIESFIKKIKSRNLEVPEELTK